MNHKDKVIQSLQETLRFIRSTNRAEHYYDCKCRICKVLDYSKTILCPDCGVLAASAVEVYQRIEAVGFPDGITVQIPMWHCDNCSFDYEDSYYSDRLIDDAIKATKSFHAKARRRKELAK